MLEALDQTLIPILLSLYEQVGYIGVFLAMAIESCCIPLPSEIILPMAGMMVANSKFDLWMTVIAATLGGTFGSIICYFIGAYGGRPLLQRYGKYVFISMHDLDVAERWFNKYGEATVFFSRLLPVVRTFISLPAGITRMNFVKFVMYSVLGALPWSFALVYAGKILGENWNDVKKALHGFDYAIAALVVILVVYYVYRHIRRAKSTDSGEVD